MRRCGSRVTYDDEQSKSLEPLMFHAAIVDRKLRESKHAEAGLESQLRLLTAVDQTALHEVALVHDDGVEEAQSGSGAASVVAANSEQPPHQELHT